MSKLKSPFLLSIAAALTMMVAAPASDAMPQRQRQRAKPAKAKAAKARTRVRGQNRPAAGAGQRMAAKTPVAKAQGSLEKALKTTGAQFYTRTVNGAKRMIFNLHNQAQLDKVSEAMGKNADVIQIVHIGRPGIMHSMAAFDGELIHAQYINGTQNWRLRPWADKFRTSGSKMYSAYIALSPSEAANLRKHIAQGRKDQGPENQAGPKWENGKLKNTSMGGCRSFNCTSVWSNMPLGKTGETLSQSVGLGANGSGHPKMFQKALEERGNDRVIGIAVMGPKLDNFKATPDAPVTQF